MYKTKSLELQLDIAKEMKEYKWAVSAGKWLHLSLKKKLNEIERLFDRFAIA
jgi:hypothetical protein